MKHTKFFSICLPIFVMLGLHAQCAFAQAPPALETITAEDGSIWERVSAPGFGNAQNSCIVSLCSYKGDLYALTRNEATGFELWRTQSGVWAQVSAPGFTDGPDA